MIDKARNLQAGEVVIDLEDAVVPELKKNALEATIEALATGGFAAPRVSVRINGLDTEWAGPELSALSSAPVRPDAIVVPKADPDALNSASALLGDDGEIRLHALIETATGLAKLDQMPITPDRLEALIIGYADLAVSLGRSARGAADLDLWLAIQDRVLASARARGLQAIDGPFFGLDDEAGLVRSATRTAELGFDGKWAIHPSHLEPIASVFAPSTDEIAYARAVVETLESAAKEGRGAARLGGQMLDEPVRQAALRTLGRAQVG